MAETQTTPHVVHERELGIDSLMCSECRALLNDHATEMATIAMETYFDSGVMEGSFMCPGCSASLTYTMTLGIAVKSVEVTLTEVPPVT